MTETAKLIEAFERAKGEIFELYTPNVPEKKGESTFDIENKLALRISKNLYGEYIDTAIKQLEKEGSISQELRSIFTISMRNAPRDNGLGHGRMETYHQRYVAKIAPILEATPVRT